MKCAIDMLSIKAGVGRSTLSLSLAKALAEEGFRVLLIDADPAGYSSHVAGIKKHVAVGISRLAEEDLKTFKVKSGLVSVLDLSSHFIYILAHELGKSYSELKSLISIMNKKYDCFIIDNPLMAKYRNDENASDWVYVSNNLSDVIPMRIYVSSADQNVIDSTVDYMKKIEAKSSNEGFPLAFVVNMIPNEAEIDQIKQRLEEITFNYGVKLGIGIPEIKGILDHENMSFEKIPIIDGMKFLALKLSREELQNKEVYIGHGKYNYFPRSILVVQPPGRDWVSTVNEILETHFKKEGTVVIVSTKENAMEAAKNLDIEYVEFSIMPKYKMDRFNVKNFDDVLKLANKISNEISYKALKFKNPIVIIYRANDICPGTDNLFYLDEFWDAFISYTMKKGEINLVLICERIGPVCDTIKSSVNKIIEY